MPQVNIITLDVAPSNDFSPVQSGAKSSSPNPKKDFAQVIDQHYQSQQSGKKQETSGNKTKLESDVTTEKDTVQEKSSTTGVQPEDKESGPVSDDDLGKEVSVTSKSKDVDQKIPDDKKTGEKTFQLENSKQETSEQTIDVLINVNTESTAPKSIENSTEQLMSLLSASQKILNGDVKNEAIIPPVTSEKSSTVEGVNKQKENTELDALLKQVLGGNNKVKTETDEANSAETTANSSAELKVNKNLTEQLNTQAAIKSDGAIKKVDPQSKPLVAVDQTVKGDSKVDLSALTEKVSGNEQAISIETTDIKKPVITQKNHTETVLKTEQVANESANVVKQKMSASDLEALLVDVKNSPIETDLEKNKVELSGHLDKTIAIDKNTPSNIKVDTSEAKVVTGAELSTAPRNEQLVSEIDTNIDADLLNTDKVAFAGVNVSGEKQAQENNQNQSRVINQATQKVLEPQTSNTGEQFKEQTKDQSLEQQNQKQTQNLSNAEKIANNEAQVKEKPFSELFDKKLVSTSIENTLARDIHQVNEATKSAASAEEMITKLTSENAQSTAQSVTNAKQVTSLQNEALSVYRKDFTGALKDKVMVMMNQKLQQIEIRLDPQELGNVNVKINLQNEQAVVSFIVQNQQAKEAFDQNLGRLKDMLAESGVDVGDANVEQQSKQNDDETLSDDHQSGKGDAAGNELSELSDTQTLNLVKGSSTGVDYYA
jgi:flagellar hook-length control protein FliK